MLKAVPSESLEEESEDKKIPFQSVSEDIWDKKYRLKSKQGGFVDKNINETYERVAKALANVENLKKENCGTKNFCGLYKMEQSLLDELLLMLEH